MITIQVIPNSVLSDKPIANAIYDYDIIANKSIYE